MDRPKQGRHSARAPVLDRSLRATSLAETSLPTKQSRLEPDEALLQAGEGRLTFGQGQSDSSRRETVSNLGVITRLRGATVWTVGPAFGTTRNRSKASSRASYCSNLQLSGLYTSGGGFFTQCEAEGFRRITYFLDRPDVMAGYTVTLRADKATYPVLLSNGNLVEQGDLDERPPLSPSGTTRSRSRATCSRWSRATWCAREQRITLARRQGRTCCRSRCGPATSTRPSTR